MALHDGVVRGDAPAALPVRMAQDPWQVRPLRALQWLRRRADGAAMTLRERITEIAEDFERKAKSLRKKQRDFSDLPQESSRLGDKASTYEYEARVLRTALDETTCTPSLCPNCLTRDEARALRDVFSGMGEPVELDAQEEAAYIAAADKIAAWCDGER